MIIYIFFFINNSKFVLFFKTFKVSLANWIWPTGRRLQTPDLIYNLSIYLHHQVLNDLDSNYILIIYTMNNQIKINHPILKLINTPHNMVDFRESLEKTLNNQNKHQNIDDININIKKITETIKKQ